MDGRLRTTFFTLDSTPTPNIQYQRYTYRETYRYDALGRRVWKRILRDANCNLHDAASGCVSAVTRTVWDGDRVLYEIRQSAGPNPGITGSQFGTVGYLNAFGVDEPIELWRGSAADIVLLYVNWRGNYQVGTCPLAFCGIDHPAFPSSEQSSYGDFFPRGAPNWYGDVITGQIDASGLLYRRNRYLDPKTGRFTQEDPLGLAGGLNAYGFARGDPVGYSDPFGLKCTGNEPSDSECNGTLQNIADNISAFFSRLDVQVGLLIARVVNEVTGAGPAVRAATGKDDAGNEISVGGRILEGVSAVASLAGAAEALDLSELKLTTTMAQHTDRGYTGSSLLIREIMQAGKPIADPGGRATALRWDVAGAIGKRAGTWELVIDVKTKEILHFTFVSR
jgi:RHS repeat-associated protein